MSKCIKTGCDVWLEEYRATVRCDLHMIDDGAEPIVIVKFNPNSWNYDPENIDCEVCIGAGYFEEYTGVLVVPLSNCNVSKYYKR
jgi:hypothetical protein